MSAGPLFDPPAGATVHCSRCKVPLRLAPQRTEDARLLRKKTTPGGTGYCLNCAVAEWFVLMGVRAQVSDPKALLLPHMQRQFAVLMKSGRADADPAEINWAHVVEHWDLPFAGDKGRKLQLEQDDEASGEAFRRRGQLLHGPWKKPLN